MTLPRYLIPALILLSLTAPFATANHNGNNDTPEERLYGLLVCTDDLSREISDAAERVLAGLWRQVYAIKCQVGQLFPYEWFQVCPVEPNDWTSFHYCIVFDDNL